MTKLHDSLSQFNNRIIFVIPDEGNVSAAGLQQTQSCKKFLCFFTFFNDLFSQEVYREDQNIHHLKK